MAKTTVGRMWHVVSIRKCVGGRWVVEGRCMADAGHALDVVGLIEMRRCVSVVSCCWPIMKGPTGPGGCEGV